VHPRPAAGVVAAVGVDVEDVASADGATLDVAERSGLANADQPEPLRAGEGRDRVRVPIWLTLR